MDFFDYASTELQWSPNRYAQMWSSLNSLGTFIENILDDDYPDFRNQVRKIEKLPKATVRKKTILTEEQVKNLLNYLSDEINSPQEACLLALMAASGSRISEVFRFTTNLIDENNTAYEDLFLETTEEIKTKGRGKQGKLLYKYILKSIFLPYYKIWLKERQDIMDKNNQNHNYIFIKADGTPAEVATARSWIRKWEKYLTEKEPSNENHDEIHFYPHCMRHWLVTHLSRIGLESELITEIMGWGSDMFPIYCDLTGKDKKWKGLDKLKEYIEE